MYPVTTTPEGIMKKIAVEAGRTVRFALHSWARTFRLVLILMSITATVCALHLVRLAS